MGRRLVQSRRGWRVLSVAVFLAAAWTACQPDDGRVTAPDDLAGVQDGLSAAIAVQDRHTDRLMAIPGVVGTATGLTADGRPAVKVYTRDASVAGVPRRIDGVPVVLEVTGEFFALIQCPGGGSPPCGGGGKPGSVDPTARFDRPVPIGVSTGNAGQCSAGTISARVTSGTDVFALSNNHIYALENNAELGSDVLQPGLVDTDCAFDANNVIGQLHAFEPIVFSTSANNTIDAAIAATSTADLGNSTPSDGYGTPTSMTVSASLGQRVQKYGRTTGLTTGAVSGINATVFVGYSSGAARFVDQIVVNGDRGGFIRAGDSGSLLVTDPGVNPVGLLFAGSPGGKTAIANRIDLVLQTFGVTIDGE